MKTNSLACILLSSPHLHKGLYFMSILLPTFPIGCSSHFPMLSTLLLMLVQPFIPRFLQDCPYVHPIIDSLTEMLPKFTTIRNVQFACCPKSAVLKVQPTVLYFLCCSESTVNCILLFQCCLESTVNCTPLFHAVLKVQSIVLHFFYAVLKVQLVLMSKTMAKVNCRFTKSLFLSPSIAC